MGSKDEQLLKIKNEVIGLEKSALAKLRIKNKSLPVIGEGSVKSKIMFIGEAPGKNEAQTGKPFCGASGRVLTQMLEHIGLKREDVYITNLVKDRPPENRDPTPKEIAPYSPFLDRQIEIIQPKVIATLGRFSMAYAMSRYARSGEARQTISRIHGKVFDAKTSYGNIKVIPLYHPAVALYQNSKKAEMFKDFEILKKFIK